MDQQALDHLGRISMIHAGLGRHQAWNEEELAISFDRLTTFDRDFWTFTRYLSLPLYEETNKLLQQKDLLLSEAPCIGVVMAVHRPDPELLRLAVRSALEQVGVRAYLYLSLDGPEGNLALVEAVLAELGATSQQACVMTHHENRGVGLTRNAALAKLQEEWFTLLDCDDIFHPLRLIHAWLAMKSHKINFLNTSYSRVSLRQKKIVLLQHCLSSSGGNSFVAHRSVLQDYGYLAPLRFWEDSEYQQRLNYYQLPMLSCSANGHYQNTMLSPDYKSLATRWRQEAYAIEGHPWLYGTVRGDMDEETRSIRNHFESLYPRIAPNELAEVFPPEGTTMTIPLSPPASKRPLGDFGSLERDGT